MTNIVCAWLTVLKVVRFFLRCGAKVGGCGDDFQKSCFFYERRRTKTKVSDVECEAPSIRSSFFIALLPWSLRMLIRLDHADGFRRFGWTKDPSARSKKATCMSRLDSSRDTCTRAQVWQDGGPRTTWRGLLERGSAKPVPQFLLGNNARAMSGNLGK